jgi:tetraacyldisaccharide 4'-kinase
MQTPEFWHIDCAAARVFTPLGWMYAAIGRWRRALAKPYRAAVPVICVGNVVAGGAGKTPVCLALAAWFKQNQAVPVFLGHGYGGLYGGPLVVDAHAHTAMQVGDEALLLTRSGVTIIGEDRASAARLAEGEGPDVLIMDDGFQNPYLHKNLSLLVVDGEYGLGNGRLIPAGPLREKLADALARADAIVFYGQDRHGLRAQIPSTKPVLSARLVPDAAQIEKLRGKKLLAFAGIGRPQKFYDLLRQQGLTILASFDFPDHHIFHASEILLLQERAQAEQAVLVTTEKDWVRLDPPLREAVVPVRVQLEWQDPALLLPLLTPLLPGN